MRASGLSGAPARGGSALGSAPRAAAQQLLAPACACAPRARRGARAPGAALLAQASCAARRAPRAAAPRRGVVPAASGSGANGSGGAAQPDVENVVIVGSGPAGYTAAIYAARANLKPVVFEGLQNGRGGQLMTTTEVENFPGFPEGITGPDLMDRMRKQAERWGAELHTEDVDSIDLSARPFVVSSGERRVRAHSVIVATGATARRLALPSEERFWSKGISACAICDGASPLFKDRPVAVVGGGDSAAEEAVYLTKYASHVHLLVRGPALRASKAMADRALAHPKVTVHFNTAVEDARGGEVLEALATRDTSTGEAGLLEVRGLFYGIGHTPNSRLVAGQVELDDAGYVKVSHGAATSVPGVFSAGDLHDTEWRQAITAAGSGCMAALSAERYLTANGLAREYKQAEQAPPEAAPAPRVRPSDSIDADTADSFDVTADRHKGQYALRKLYHESDRPIAVLYTSPTCGPCRSLKPIFNAVVGEYAGRVHAVEIDIEADPEIAEAGGVTGTPTVQVFFRKERVASMVGVKQKSQYRGVIEECLQGARVPAVTRQPSSMRPPHGRGRAGAGAAAALLVVLVLLRAEACPMGSDPCGQGCTPALGACSEGRCYDRRGALVECEPPYELCAGVACAVDEFCAGAACVPDSCSNRRAAACPGDRSPLRSVTCTDARHRECFRSERFNCSLAPGDAPPEIACADEARQTSGAARRGAMVLGAALAALAGALLA
ncbi:hypothetical protein HT031_000979 [Scenedesmus sp. PABB004]|nr:hypothetical protein HT031_000979 [Scenedesmus sp. PABB004]